MAGQRIFVSGANGNRVLVYNSVPESAERAPDYALGSPDICTNTLESNFFITNPVPASNGTSLFISSDFDRKLYVWKRLPDESGARPDFVYRLPDAPWQNTLWGTTLALAGARSVFIWKQLPTDGRPPDVQLRDRIGSVRLQEVRGVAYDGRYFFLSDRQANRVYVWDGLPSATSEPLLELTVQGPGRLASDGAWLLVSPAEGPAIQAFRLDQLTASSQPRNVGGPGVFNLPQHATLAGGKLFVADTVFNRVHIWNAVEAALEGRPADVVLGPADRRPATRRDGLFWPGALSFDGSYLWVGEFKFSGRVLRFSLQPPLPPAATAVVNAATFAPGIAPGSLVSIFGTNLAGAAVSVNGVAAPVLYTSATQINAQVPFEASPGTASLSAGASTLSFAIAAAAPGIFKLQGERAALQAARPGDYVTIWLTGQGQVQPPIATGSAAPENPLSRATLPVKASVGGRDAEVQYAGLAPGYIGLMQLNLRLPDVPAGDQPVAVAIGGAASNTATIPVAGTPPPTSLTSDFTPPKGRGCPLEVRGGPCGKRLLSARSPDGLTFTRTNQIVTDQGDVPDVVVDQRGWIYVYYIGATVGTELNKLAVAISSDRGATWIYKKAILDGFAGMSEPVDPDVQILPDGTFRLYVTTGPAGQPVRTWYAEGTDGIRFQRKGLAFNPPGEPLDPSTLLINGVWHIFAGGGTPTPGANWHGTSADGTSFAYDGERPFVKDGLQHAVSNGIAVPGGYRFYAFTHQAPPVINSFFSTGGVTWTAEGGTRLQMDASAGLESAGVKDAAVARLADGSYFMVYVTEIGDAPVVQPQNPLQVTRAYLMAFHACDKAVTNCGDPRNHSVYLAESDDGAAWNLVKGWKPYSGSVPDVIRRGNTLYVFSAGQNPLVRAHLDTGIVDAPTPVTVDGLTQGFVDPSLIVDEQGRLVLFFLYGRMGGDPAGCPAGQTTCTQQFGSATEVAGSDGARFTLDAGDRVTLPLGGAADPRSASDPDIFFDGARYVMYISHGGSTSVWTSTELRGSYRKAGDLSAGTGGVPSGYFDSASQRYWTYAHTLRDGNTVIRRAIHPDLTRLLGETDWQTVIAAPALGFGSTTNVESPGFAVSGVKR